MKLSEFFYLIFFQFLEEKFSIYLDRHVFVMYKYILQIVTQLQGAFISYFGSWFFIVFSAQMMVRQNGQPASENPKGMKLGKKDTKKKEGSSCC